MIARKVTFHTYLWISRYVWLGSLSRLNTFVMWCLWSAWQQWRCSKCIWYWISRICHDHEWIYDHVQCNYYAEQRHLCVVELYCIYRFAYSLITNVGHWYRLVVHFYSMLNVTSECVYVRADVSHRSSCPKWCTVERVTSTPACCCNLTWLRNIVSCVRQQAKAVFRFWTIKQFYWITYRSTAIHT